MVVSTDESFGRYRVQGVVISWIEAVAIVITSIFNVVLVDL